MLTAKLTGLYQDRNKAALSSYRSNGAYIGLEGSLSENSTVSYSLEVSLYRTMSHAELLATNAIYQEVYNSQTQGGGDFDKQGGAQ